MLTFHPSKFINFNILRRIIGYDDINGNELKENIVELKNQEKLCKWHYCRPPRNLPIGIDELFGKKTQIIIENNHELDVDWNNWDNYKFFLTNIDQIRRFKDKINWMELVRYEKLPWNLEFISEFESYLIQDLYGNGKTEAIFSNIPSVPWTFELIEKYKDYWHWLGLSTNTGIKWSEKIISKYVDKWNWEALSTNTGIKWSEKIILKYVDKWNWDLLTINPNIIWTESLIYNFKSQLNWRNLSSSYNINWGIDLIKKFEMFWKWEELAKNTSIPWDAKFIQTFIHKDKYYWGVLCRNKSITWNAKLIRKFKNKIEWYSLSGNPSLFVSKKDIFIYKDYWRWDQLCKNEAVAINENFLFKFSNYISFQGKESYGARGNYHYNVPEYLMNNNLKLSVEDVRKLSHKNNWKKDYVNINNSENYPDPGEWVWFSRNKNLTKELLHAFIDFFDWKTLSANEYIPWNIKLVLEFKDYWKWETLMDNNAFWSKIIEPQIDLLSIKNINEMFNHAYIEKQL